MNEPDPSLSCVLCVEHFKISTQVWNETFATAVYLRNYDPTKAVNVIIPFIILVGEKPNVETFSYAACANVPEN